MMHRSRAASSPSIARCSSIGKKHFVDLFGTVPPAAAPTIERLQTIQHRVFVDRSGATVSEIPKASLPGIAHGAELERGLQAMVSGGLNGWLPFSTNVILPTGRTKFNFEKIDTGYKLIMDGPGVAATLLLGNDLRLTSAVSQLPQPMRFSTEFTDGPNGFLLDSIKTGSTTDTTSIGRRHLLSLIREFGAFSYRLLWQ